MSNLPEDFPFLRVGEIVQHKGSGLVGKVERFEHPGTDVWIDGTGPYPQIDFRRLKPELKPGEPGASTREDGSCSCRTFSECTHK